VSRPDVPPPPAPADDDLVAALAYLDGKLDAAAARAFELRLGTEPELARAFEELAALDDELRASLATGADRSRGPGRLVLPTVAALVVVALGAVWWTGRRADVAHGGFRLALVGTAPSDAGFTELLGFDPDWLPLGLGYRDAGADEPPAADAWAAALGDALAQRVAGALDARAAALEAPSVVLALEPARDSHVVLVAARPGRPPERLLPRATPSAPLAAGRTHLLPDRPLRLPDDSRATQRVEYAPGILTRDGVELTLGLRARPIGSELADELDAWLAAAPPGRAADALAAWLAERGFETRRLRVVPPGGG